MCEDKGRIMLFKTSDHCLTDEPMYVIKDEGKLLLDIFICVYIIFILVQMNTILFGVIIKQIHNIFVCVWILFWPLEIMYQVKVNNKNIYQ